MIEVSACDISLNLFSINFQLKDLLNRGWFIWIEVSQGIPLQLISPAVAWMYVNISYPVTGISIASSVLEDKTTSQIYTGTSYLEPV